MPSHYDPDLPVRVACDASPYILGAVLSHVMSDGSEKPVAFALRTVNRAERNYSQIDKEALALVWGIRKFNHYLYGRRFTLVTDHQPLTAIFHPEKGIPAMTAARMQRYALQLATHDYEIKYRTSAKHANADGLSRLPMATGKTATESDVMDNFYMNHMDVWPITASVIQSECSKDPVLSKVLGRTQHGWPKVSPVGLEPLFSKRHELSIFHGCIMWGIRGVVPHKLRNQILHELHEGHIGIVEMKGLARSYVWWPGIDQDIESLAKKCQGYQKVQFEAPTVPLHPWKWPIKPWQRIHVDYAGPFMGHMFLIVVDAHSKWAEVLLTGSTSSERTVELLREVFARYGLPEHLHSDNGRQFTSEVFQNFMKVNNIKHTFSAPYHPATYGQAERFVQTFK